MEHEKIELTNIQKMFVFEQQSRILDGASREQAIEIAKCYLKLYLKQQEVLNVIGLPDGGKQNL